MRVVAADLRRHGNAPRTSSYRLSDHAADLLVLGSGWDVVVGHSLAGPIVAMAATTTGFANRLLLLQEDAVRRLYGDLAGLVRQGGVMAHAEQMPLADRPRLAIAVATIERLHRTGRDDAQARWDAWWEHSSHDPALQRAMAQRQSVFAASYPAEEFSPPADWHITALRDAGFTEAGVVWRSGAGAVVAAVR